MATAQTVTRTTPSHAARRILGALALEDATYREVSRTRETLPAAAALVLAAGLARGAGAWADEGVAGLVGSPLTGLAIWLVGSALVHAVATRWLGATATLGAVLRASGFAATPLLLLALGALPLAQAGGVLWWAAHAWATLAMLVAARAALDVGARRALLACAVAVAIGFACTALLGALVAEWGAFD